MIVNVIIIAIGAVFGGVLNRIRGGGLKPIVAKIFNREPRPDGKAPSIGVSGAWVVGALLGLSIFFLSWNWMAALAVAGAYILGECFGWTKWIACIPNQLTQEDYNNQWLEDDTGKKDGTYWIAQLVSKERKNYWLHCLAGMIARGVLWWVPVFTALWWFQMATMLEAVASVIFLSLTFPLIYWLAYRLPLPSEYFKDHYIRRAEVLYGLIYGAVLVAILVVTEGA